MLGITLVTSCAPKAGIHHLGDPSLLRDVSLGFWGALFYENLRFLLYLCVAGWVGAGAPICLELP